MQFLFVYKLCLNNSPAVWFVFISIYKNWSKQLKTVTWLHIHTKLTADNHIVMNTTETLIILQLTFKLYNFVLFLL